MAARQHDYGNAQRISLAYLLARWPQHAGDGLPEGIATRDPRAAWREEMSAKWRVRNTVGDSCGEAGALRLPALRGVRVGDSCGVA